MDFSIIVPVLNEPAYLHGCLQALRNLDYPTELYEIIFIDNGSTDESIEILQREIDGAPITLLQEPQRDAYLARNRGIATARGRFIAFTDADCTVAPDWLKRLSIDFKKPGVDMIVGRLTYPQGASFWLRLYADYYDAKSEWIFGNAIVPCYYGHGGNMAIRSEVFERVGPFLESPIVGDTEILHRLLEDSPDRKVVYNAALTVMHVEVSGLRTMLSKLKTYGGYSDAISRASKYRPLTFAERMNISVFCIRENQYGPLRCLALAVVLLAGIVNFESGRLKAAQVSSTRVR